jgi:putative endonuclease
MNIWRLYIIRTRLGTLYTGVTTDINRRLIEHASPGKKGAKYLRSKAPLELVYHAKIGSHSLACKVEYQIKQLSKHKKEALVAVKPGSKRLMRILKF